MKRHFLISLIFFQFANSQNLVPNGSFEDYYQCPTPNSLLGLSNWFKLSNHINTPDYYNSCSEQLGSSIPENFVGSQFPYSGNAYIGLWSYNGLNENAREYVWVELVNPLITGQNYEVSFYVSLCDICEFAINNIGITFTNEEIIGDNTLQNVNFIPQINSLEIISDKINWIKISGIFSAYGGERFLTIGNFYTDEQTSEISIENTGEFGEYIHAYYYIDNVSVIETDLPSDDECLKILNPVLDYIYLNTSSDINSLDIILFDISGKQIKKKIINNEIYVGDLSDGVYIIHYSCGNESDYKKIIKI